MIESRAKRGVGAVANLTAYLDLIRVLAAIAVASSHVLPPFRIGSVEPAYGHDAVVFFFVLSGFVIALVCDTRETTARDYAMSRLTRIWSVAVPALLFGLGLQTMFGGLPSISAASPSETWAAALPSSLMSLIFCGEGWSGTWTPPFNGPFWSLNYEAWYYACYGALMFLSGRARWMTALALFALSGPRVMALAPCWFAGVALYRWRDKLELRPTVAWPVFFASLATCAAIECLDLSIVSRAWLKALTNGQSYHLGSSQALIGDFILTGAIFANFTAVASLPGIGRMLAPVRRPITAAASLTLSIYLYHMPFMTLITLSLGLGPSTGVTGALTVLALSGAGIAILGSATELKRREIRKMIDGAFARIGRRPPVEASRQ